VELAFTAGFAGDEGSQAGVRFSVDATVAPTVEINAEETTRGVSLENGLGAAGRVAMYNNGAVIVGVGRSVDTAPNVGSIEELAGLPIPVGVAKDIFAIGTREVFRFAQELAGIIRSTLAELVEGVLQPLRQHERIAFFSALAEIIDELPFVVTQNHVRSRSG